MVPHDHHNGAHRGLNKIHIFYVDGLRIIHTGDLGCIPSKEVLDKIRQADILLAPINGHYTISSLELIELIKLVEPRLTIPMHYYKSWNNSGYPDGNQIDVFEASIDKLLVVDDYQMDITDRLFQYQAIVFFKEKQ